MSDDDRDPDLLYATPEDMPALREEVKRLRRALTRSNARIETFKLFVEDVADRLGYMKGKLIRE
jgi:hypothetical protein